MPNGRALSGARGLKPVMGDINALPVFGAYTLHYFAHLRSNGVLKHNCDLRPSVAVGKSKIVAVLNMVKDG